MSIDFVQRKYIQLAGNLGKGALSILFPKDFEAYIMGLELCDSNDNTIDYFAFPILPKNISKTEFKRTNIKKTISGTTILNSNNFSVGEITIKGDFGRNFKFVLSPTQPSVQGFAFSINSGVYDLLGTKQRGLNFNIKNFNIGIKTGFGAFNILKAIINKSNGTDNLGKPFKLYFYNMALGESYLVSVPSSGFTSSQSMDKNMIWEYNLTLNILSPLEYLSNTHKKNSLIKLLAVSEIQSGLNALSKDLLNLTK